jgi:hypothetical protein
MRAPAAGWSTGPTQLQPRPACSVGETGRGLFARIGTHMSALLLGIRLRCDSFDFRWRRKGGAPAASEPPVPAEPSEGDCHGCSCQPPLASETGRSCTRSGRAFPPKATVLPQGYRVYGNQQTGCRDASPTLVRKLTTCSSGRAQRVAPGPPGTLTTDSAKRLRTLPAILELFNAGVAQRPRMAGDAAAQGVSDPSSSTRTSTSASEPGSRPSAQDRVPRPRIRARPRRRAEVTTPTRDADLADGADRCRSADAPPISGRVHRESASRASRW